MKTVYILVAFLIFSTLKIDAQTFHLVKDINTTTNSSPAAFRSINGIIYFADDDGIHGTELWRSDGTEQGTWIVADINKGEGNSMPSGMTEGNNGIIYFKAYTEEYGFELWKTDGTAAGTKMVKDIYPGSESAFSDSYYDNYFTYVNGIMFFTATTAKAGLRLWKTDGTAKGTVIVSPNQTYGSSPNNLASYDGKVYYFGSGPHSDSLFTSDGTPQGTYGIKAIDRYFVDIWSYTGILVMNNIMYFTASPPQSNGNNIELWRSDGTVAGTYIVKDINPTYGSTPNNLTALNNTLYFDAFDGTHGDELWKSDGTAAGTSLVYDVSNSDATFIIGYIVAFHDSIFYTYRGEDKNSTGLWKTNGTAEGTVKAIDFNCYDLKATPSTLFFTKSDSATGNELWKTDGTTAGTSIVKDINAGKYDGIYTYDTVFAAGDFVYFRASTLQRGAELWKSNGNSNETIMVKDINTKSSQGAAINFLPTYGDKLFFTAYTPKYGAEPYLSDGTDSGTYLLKQVVPGFDASADIINVVTFHDSLFFQELNNNAKPKPLYNQYQSDGTRENTILKYQSELKSANFTAAKNNIFFSYATPLTGNELWKTNESITQSSLVKDIRPGSKGSSLSSFIMMDDILYFTANDSTHGEELWRSNGTAKGTNLGIDLYPGSFGAVPSLLYTYQHHLFFHTPLYNHLLWVSSGTASGTKQLVDSATGESLTNLQTSFTASNGFVYFSAYSNRSGYELWKTNGKSNKAVLVKDITPGITSSGISNLTDVNGILFFTVSQYNSYGGNYLWRSDGTDSGTYLVKDIFPGNTHFEISSLVNAGGTLAFLARDNWYESSDSNLLWTSDGTASGTVQSTDTAFKNLKIISQLVAIKNRLYFVGQNYKYGDELWSGLIINSSVQNMYATKESLPSMSVSVFPNPFTELLYTSIQSKKEEKINISIIDVNGKILTQQKTNLQPGNNQITLNMKSYKPGAYFLRVTDYTSTSAIKIYKLN